MVSLLLFFGGIAMENKKLTGDFLLIEGYAQWENDEEWEKNRYDDERPTAILAIKKWFLQKFAEDSGYGSLEEFFGDYTWETIESLQAEAEMAAAFAFAYRPTLEPHFQFPEVMTAEMAQALVEFMESEPIYERITKALPKNPVKPFAAIGNNIIVPSVEQGRVVASFLTALGVEALMVSPMGDENRGRIWVNTGDVEVSAEDEPVSNGIPFIFADCTWLTGQLSCSLEEGPVTENGERCSEYLDLITFDGKSFKVQLIERKGNDGKPSYYSIHFIDDINETDCQLVDTKGTSVEEIANCLKLQQNMAFSQWEKTRDQNVEVIVAAKFVSVWDGGTCIETECKVNLKTKEVFDIEVVEDVADMLDTLDEEYIVLPGVKETVVPLDERENDEYWYR